MYDEETAFLRSASGTAAGAFLEVPLDERWVMSNDRFATASRRRLGLEFPSEEVCPTTEKHCTNTSATGRRCGAICDGRGMHLECCAPGGGLVVRHDGIERCLGILAARNVDPHPKLEQVMPQLAQPVPGQVSQARLDVVVHNGASRNLVDVVVSSVYAGDQRFRGACARRDGHAARRAAISKRTKYQSPEICPFRS